jgi:ribosomal protein S27AE
MDEIRTCPWCGGVMRPIDGGFYQCEDCGYIEFTPIGHYEDNTEM